MYSKYRVFIATTRGSYYAAAGNSVNGLVQVVERWLDDTSIVRSIYDDTVLRVVLMQLDEERGYYKIEKQLPATSRQDIIAKLRALGGR